MTEFPTSVRFNRGPMYRLKGPGPTPDTMRYVPDTFMPNWSKEWLPQLTSIAMYVQQGRAFLTPDYSADLRVREGL